MGFNKLAAVCENCKFLKWCPNKRMEASAVASNASDNVMQNTLANAVEPGNLSDSAALRKEEFVENLREELARTYGFPGCFFGGKP